MPLDQEMVCEHLKMADQEREDDVETMGVEMERE